MDGKRVTFSVTKDTTATGIIQAQILMREKKDDPQVITGFIILDEEDNCYKSIAHWRLLHPTKTDQGHLKGGYRKDRLGSIDNS